MVYVLVLSSLGACHELPWIGLCYDLITQVAILALRLEDGLRVRGKGIHNILSIRRYNVSTAAYIPIVV